MFIMFPFRFYKLVQGEVRECENVEKALLNGAQEIARRGVEAHPVVHSRIVHEHVETSA